MKPAPQQPQQTLDATGARYCIPQSVAGDMGASHPLGFSIGELYFHFLEVSPTERHAREDKSIERRWRLQAAARRSVRRLAKCDCGGECDCGASSWENYGPATCGFRSVMERGEVVLEARGNAKDGGDSDFSGLVVCGHHACPYCGPRFYDLNRKRLTLVASAVRKLGLVSIFVTLTVPHGPSDDLGELVSMHLSAIDESTSGRASIRHRQRIGYVGAIRVFENKSGGRNGHHPHSHLWVICDPAAAAEYRRKESAKTVAKLERRAKRAEERASKPRAWPKTKQAAQDVREAAQAAQDAHDAIGERVGPSVLHDDVLEWYRQTYVGHLVGAGLRTLDGVTVDVTVADDPAGYITKAGLDVEMSKPMTKTDNGSYSPLQLLALYDDDHNRRWLHLYGEYIKATKGRSIIRTTRGLYERLGIAEQIAALEEAEQAADDDDADKAPLRWAVKLTRDEWRHLCAAELQAELLIVTRRLNSTPESVGRWLAYRGILMGGELGDFVGRAFYPAPAPMLDSGYVQARLELPP